MSADGTVSWQQLLDETVRRLRGAAMDSAALDARRIIEEASGHEGSELAAGLTRPATTRGVAHLDAMVARRLTGEPLQYVLGRWGFRSLDLMVDRRVLIPRPETEVIAGVAIAELERRGTASMVAADLGTGSGAIGLSIAVESTGTAVVLTDASPEALEVARANLAGLGMAGRRVEVRQGAWFEALDPGRHRALDLIVSNPPYVCDNDPLPASVADWEPPGALRAGADGLDDLRVLVSTAGDWLAPGGSLVVELDPRQARTVTTLARAAGFVDVAVITDLAGRDRGVRARLGDA